jgi:hypothetical protein
VPLVLHLEAKVVCLPVVNSYCQHHRSSRRQTEKSLPYEDVNQHTGVAFFVVAPLHHLAIVDVSGDSVV